MIESYGQIMHNIGLVFVQQDKYSEAAVTFEYINRTYPSVKSYIHLLLCLYALGEKSKISRTFRNLANSNLIKKENLEQMEKIVFLISPLLNELYCNGDGFQWCLDTLRLSSAASVADDLEIIYGVHLLHNGKFHEANHLLKFFINNFKALSEKSLINLSFICLALDKLQNAETILRNCRSIKALNNFGVFYYKLGYFQEAKNIFKLCLKEGEIYEAMYNLALVEEKCCNCIQSLEILQKSLIKDVWKDFKILQLNLSQQSQLATLKNYLSFEKQYLSKEYLDPKINLQIANLQQDMLLYKEAWIRYYDVHKINLCCNTNPKRFFKNCLDLGKLQLGKEFIERFRLLGNIERLERIVVDCLDYIPNENCWKYLVKQFPNLKNILIGKEKNKSLNFEKHAVVFSDDITALLPLT